MIPTIRPHTAALAEIALCLATLVCPSAYPSMALANTDIAARWDAKYASTSASHQHAGCQLCHVDSNPIATGTGSPWNAYGNALKPLPPPRTPEAIDAKLIAVQSANSDGDAGGATNLQEINASVQPGWKIGTNIIFTLVGGTIQQSSAQAPTNIGLLDPSYTVGGAVSGLTGSVTLRNNGGDNLVRTTNGIFTFATALTTGSAYAVTVFSQPTGQTCTVANGSGTIASANVTNVAVTCVTNPVATFTVGGTVSGLTGSVTLRNNGVDSLVRTANGIFTFTTALAHRQRLCGDGVHSAGRADLHRRQRQRHHRVGQCHQCRGDLFEYRDATSHEPRP